MTIKKATGYPSIDRIHLKNISLTKRHPLILPLSLFSTFLLINSRNLNEPALISQNTSYTGQQLKDDVTKAIKAFLLSGLQPGEAIAIVSPNLYEGIVLTFAANAIGIKVIYLNNLSTTDQIFKELSAFNANALAVFECDEYFADTAYAEVSTLRLIINIDPDTPTTETSFRFIHYNNFLESSIYFRGNISIIMAKHRFSKKDAIFLQTSGSTSGKPKILPFSNKNIFASLIYASNSTGTKTNDASVKKVLCILPYRLPYGWMTIFVNLLGGNLVELAQGATPEHIAEYWKTGASYIYGTPQIFQDFVNGTPDDADLSFLQAFFASGFSISEARYQEGVTWLHQHNCSGEIRNNYGIGEALCIGTASDGVPHRKNTSGKFYVGPEWVIVDDNLEEVKYGEVGELLVFSKSLFSGYFNDSEATKDVFVHFRKKRFYRTGDYVSLSEDGYVTFLGRKKRFYQPQGATDKVNCETIERALNNLTDYIKESAVVIYSPDGKSEASCAFVTLESNLAPDSNTQNQIFNLLADQLLDYQLPQKIIFIDELPLMKSGKPNYVMLEKIASKN